MPNLPARLRLKRTESKPTDYSRLGWHLPMPYLLIIALLIIFAGLASYLLLSSHAVSTLSADFNGDGTVNALDLSILASHWGSTGATKSTGDANSDGTINIYDLSILAAEWGQTVTPSPTPTSTPTPTPSGPVFNVMNPAYGAVGDGVHDDAPAIQKAYMAADAANGGTVLFPSGHTFLVDSNWAMPAIRTNDYFTKNADGSQSWSTPTVHRSGMITMSGYGATIKFTGTGRVGFLYNDVSSDYWDTYGDITIEGFTFDNNYTNPDGMTGRIFWIGGSGNVDNVTITDVKLIHVSDRVSTEYPAINGISIRPGWSSSYYTQPKWGYIDNITITNSDIEAMAKSIDITLAESTTYFSTVHYMIDNVLIDGVTTNNHHYTGSSIQIGGMAAGRNVTVKNSTMENSSDDGLEINAFDSIDAENNNYSGTRQAICLVWFSYPFSSTPPTILLKNQNYSGDLGAYWPQATTPEPALRPPMIPEWRAYVTNTDTANLKNRSWGNLTIDGGDIEFGVNQPWGMGMWNSTYTLGSNTFPISSITIENVNITANGPNDGPLIYIKQGGQLGTTLPVTISNVNVRRSINASFAPITTSDISLSGSTHLNLSAQ